MHLLMIWAAIIILAAIEQFIDMGILIFVQFANCGISLYEVTKSESAINALKSTLKPYARVKRDGRWQEIAAKASCTLSILCASTVEGPCRPTAACTPPVCKLTRVSSRESLCRSSCTAGICVKWAALCFVGLVKQVSSLQSQDLLWESSNPPQPKGAKKSNLTKDHFFRRFGTHSAIHYPLRHCACLAFSWGGAGVVQESLSFTVVVASSFHPNRDRDHHHHDSGLEQREAINVAPLSRVSQPWRMLHA